LQSILLIFLSAILGLGLGWLMHLYLKYIGAEILLFLTALIYTVSFLCDHFHLESALMFIAAGFFASNWSEYGDKLIKEVERLSTPVFVVFFTLAGAHLELDKVAIMAVPAILLSGIRAGAFFVGVRAGATIFNADEGSRKYGWMGFVSQAGLAITLAGMLQSTLGGDLGAELFSFILAGVAINEIIGPAMLQSSLALAGEIPKDSISTSDGAQKVRAKGWFEPPAVHDELLTVFTTVRTQLSLLHSETTKDILSRRKREIQLVLEREDIDWGEAFRTLSSRNMLQTWDSENTLYRLDTIADMSSDNQELPFEAISFMPEAGDSAYVSFRKGFARTLSNVLKRTRVIDVRNAARYHLSARCLVEFITFGEDLIAVEEKIARGLSTKDRDLLAKCLDDIDQVGETLEDILAWHHRQFCQDLIHLGTFRLSSRQLGMAFTERNKGVQALRIDKPNIESFVEAHWAHAFYQFQKDLLQRNLKGELWNVLEERWSHVSSFVESCTEYDHVLKQWKTDMEPLLQQGAFDELEHQTKSLLDGIRQIVSKGEKAVTFGQSSGLSDTRSLIRRFPQNLTLLPTVTSYSWKHLTEVSLQTVPIRSSLRTILESRILPSYEQLWEEIFASFKELISVYEELIQVTDYNLRQTILNRDTFEVGKDALLNTTDRIHNRSELQREQFAKQEYPHRVTDYIEDLCAQLVVLSEARQAPFESSVSPPSIWPIVREPLHRLRSIAYALLTEQDQLEVLHPRKELKKDFLFYLRLMEADSSDNISLLPSRTSLRKRLLSDIQQSGVYLLTGPYAEVCAIAHSVAQTYTGKIQVVEPSRLIGEDELPIENPVMMIIGLRWLFRGRNDEDCPLRKLIQHIDLHPEQTWILAEDEFVWNTLSKAFLLKNYITTHYELPLLSRNELEKIILARHQLSGYRLQYPKKHELAQVKDRVLGREDPQKEFFRILYQRCEGDLEEGFLQWLSAFESIDDQEGVIYLRNHSHSIRAHLERLSGEQLLLLRQILVNGWVDIPLAQLWFCSTVVEARANIHALSNRGWIEAQNQFWVLNPAIRYSLCSLLKERGWL
ncbi:MAG: hypothetical protein VX278_20115, partial [Myxococcota bacterium]|nr:hypothetical protein [Myxococcota bacterium]